MEEQEDNRPQQTCNRCGGTEFCGCGACLECLGPTDGYLCAACLDDA